MAQAKGSLFFGIENGSMGELHKQVADLQRQIDDQNASAQAPVAFASEKDQKSASGLVW
ncbi:hypothetical protein D3C78_1960180 [compost metagenome]